MRTTWAFPQRKASLLTKVLLPDEPGASTPTRSIESITLEPGKQFCEGEVLHDSISHKYAGLLSAQRKTQSVLVVAQAA